MDFRGNEQYYIYGKLNKSEILKEYTPAKSNTTETIIDNDTNEISVEVIKLPHKLSFKEAEEMFTSFDASTDVIIDLTKYATNIKLDSALEKIDNEKFTTIELIPSVNHNTLVCKDKLGNTITSVDLSPFVQRQSNLAESDESDETFVQNKSTKYLTNDGENGTSKYATQKWTQDEISKHSIDLDVVKDISLSQNETPDYLAIKKDVVNLNSREEKSEDVTLPLATNSKSGLMSSADVNSISDLKNRVGNLEGKTTRLLYSENENPTIEQINTFVENAGYTSPFEGVAVVVDKTFHIWHYYENTGWQDDGQDTVSIFTNNIAGIIKGSETEGRIYAENDGTGSLVGYDNLKNKADIIKNDGTGNQYLSDDGKYKVIRTNRQFNSTWKIDGTTLEFIQSILADSSATVGMSYLGGVEFTDLPTGASGTKLGNAECLVEIISSTLSSDAKVIHLDLFSATTKPYHWSTIYYTSLPDPIWAPDVMESEITDIKSDITNLTTKVTTNTNNITDIQNDVTTITAKLNTVEEGAQVNTISSISLNGAALTPDSNKNVEVTIPETKVDGTTIKTADSGAIQAVGVKTLSDLVVTGDTIYNGTIPVMKSGDILDLVKYVMSSSQNFKECPFIYIDGTITQSLPTKEDAIKNKVLLRYLGGDSSTYFYFEAYNVMATKQKVTEAVSYCTLTGLTTVGSISNVDNYKNAIIQIVKSNSVRIADFQYVKSGVEVDNTTITKNANSQIQAIALTNGTDTIDYEALKKAMTITIEE